MPCFSIRSKLLSEEIYTRMEGAICQGWLTKSPPEKKMSGPRRIFPSKWRKRYFVLRMPPAASSLPGSCGLLEYYDSPRCTKRKGSIDLDQCEEVTLSLDTYDYNHLFALSSKHKGRNRTYYLAADTEDTMNHWVECLCKVCGFKPDDEHNTGDEDWPHQPAPTPNERYTPEFDRFQSSTHMPDIVPDQGRRAPVVDNEPITGTHSYNSRRPTATSQSSLPSTLALDSVPPPPSWERRELRTSVDSTDSVPEEPAPLPPTKTGLSRLDNYDTPTHDLSTYDHPRMGYENLMPATPVHQNPENTYQVPPPPTPVGGARRTTTTKPDNMLINVPPALPTTTTGGSGQANSSSKRDSNSSNGSRGSNKQDSAYSSEDTYDPVPPPRRYSGERKVYGKEVDLDLLAHNMRISTTLDNRSNASNKKVHVQQKALSETNVNSLNESVPPPASMAPQQPYINLPPNSKAHPSYENMEDHTRGSHHHHHHHHHHNHHRPRHHSNSSNHSRSGGNGQSGGGSVPPAAVTDSTYDVPPSRKDDSEILGLAPPPPAHALPKMHVYVNSSPAGGYNKSNRFVPPPPLPGGNKDDDVYLPMGAQSSYLPMNQASSSLGDSYVPLPQGDRTSDGSYLNMDSSSGGGGNGGNSLARKKGAANDNVYLPMQWPESDTYMPMVGGQTYDENYVPMMTGDRSSSNSVYTDMSVSSPPPVEQQAQRPVTHSIYEVPPSNKPVPIVPPRTTAEPPRLQPQSTSTNVTDGVLIFGSQRTRSFKREVPRQPPPDPPLPRKKASGSTGDSSSSEDDDESSSSLDRSSDTIPTHKPSKVETLSKKSLNSTPPPPKRPGEVQYLDLALDKNSETERSPVFPRSPPPPVSRHTNASPTEYKEIDFVKTKALTEMKKDVESKRKSSEKSVDE